MRALLVAAAGERLVIQHRAQFQARADERACRPCASRRGSGLVGLAGECVWPRAVRRNLGCAGPSNARRTLAA